MHTAIAMVNFTFNAATPNPAFGLSMTAVKIVKWERGPVESQLVGELMSRCDLDMAEAQALVREIVPVVPYQIQAESPAMAVRIAQALTRCGAEVLVDDGLAL